MEKKFIEQQTKEIINIIQKLATKYYTQYKLN